MRGSVSEMREGQIGQHPLYNKCTYRKNTARKGETLPVVGFPFLRAFGMPVEEEAPCR